MVNAVTADLTALAQDFAAASNEGIFKASQQVIQSTAETVQREAMSRAPFKTGALRSSISIRYVNALKAVIGPQVEYGVYQEFGTGTRGEFPTGMYEIKPQKGKYLSFTVNGKRVVTKIVHHPGISARPYMRPAFAAALGEQLTATLAEKGALLITKGRSAE